MKSLFSAEGRIGRGGYFLMSLAIVGVIVVLCVAAGMLVGEVVGGVIGLIGLVVACVASVFLAIRRFHDLDRPGSDYWFMLIPFYNIYLSFVLLFKKGTEGPNKFGDVPA